MNVIFLDLDGVLYTHNSILKPLDPEDGLEKRVKILSDICHKYNCKVVISSSKREKMQIYLNPDLDEELKQDMDNIIELLNLFEKYEIEIYGMTPIRRKKYKLSNNKVEIIDMWREYEIYAYLRRHPEIEHFCVIDDDDRVKIPDREKGNFKESDLNMFREYLVSPIQYSKIDPLESGLNESHIEEVGKILQKKRIY